MDKQTEESLLKNVGDLKDGVGKLVGTVSALSKQTECIQRKVTDLSNDSLQRLSVAETKIEDLKEDTKKIEKIQFNCSGKEYKPVPKAVYVAGIFTLIATFVTCVITLIIAYS